MTVLSQDKATRTDGNYQWRIEGELVGVTG